MDDKETQNIPKEELSSKDHLKQAKEFMFKLCEYIVMQTDNGRTRLRMLEGDVCGDGFKLESIQYKNGKRDFVLYEYNGNKQTSLNFAKTLEPFYVLFQTKVF